MNVLGKIIIPRTTKSIEYILAELEELGREEFFRLKRVKENKLKNNVKNAIKIKDEDGSGEVTKETINKSNIDKANKKTVEEPKKISPAVKPSLPAEAPISQMQSIQQESVKTETALQPSLLSPETPKSTIPPLSTIIENQRQLQNNDLVVMKEPEVAISPVLSITNLDTNAIILDGEGTGQKISAFGEGIVELEQNKISDLSNVSTNESQKNKSDNNSELKIVSKVNLMEFNDEELHKNKDTANGDYDKDDLTINMQNDAVNEEINYTIPFDKSQTTILKDTTKPKNDGSQIEINHQSELKSEVKEDNLEENNTESNISEFSVRDIEEYTSGYIVESAEYFETGEWLENGNEQKEKVEVIENTTTNQNDNNSNGNSDEAAKDERKPDAGDENNHPDDLNK